MKKMPKTNFINFFRLKWFNVVDEQIKSISESHYGNPDNWKHARDFMNKFVEDNQDSFEFLFQNDKSEDKLFTMRIINEIEQYINNSGFDKIKNSKHYNTKKSEFVRDLDPIKNNAKKLIDSLSKLGKTYPILLNTASFNHTILFEIFKKLKDKEYEDHFQNITLNNIYKSMLQNGGVRDLPSFAEILSAYLEILENDLKENVLDEPYKELPRLKNKDEEIIKLQILYNKLIENKFINHKKCLDEIEKIVKSLDEEGVAENYNFSENKIRQMNRIKTKISKK